MSFGNWPPQTSTSRYARVDRVGAILFQSTPPLLDSIGHPNPGEYNLNFNAGGFDQSTQAIMVTPADTSAPGGRPNVEVGTPDSANVFMTDDAGAGVDNAFYLEVVTS